MRKRQRASDNLSADLGLVAGGGVDVDERDTVDDGVELRRGRSGRGERAEGGPDGADGHCAEEDGDEGLHDHAADEAARRAQVKGALRVVALRLCDELGAGKGGHAVHGVEGEEHQAPGGAEDEALAQARGLGVGEEVVVAPHLVLFA